jgi:SulP family sulfate permease
LAAANFGAGILQGFPVKGSQSRSFTAAEAGARSQMSNWIGAVLVLITLLVLTRPFEILPSATLAGIVIVVGLGLVDMAASDVSEPFGVLTSCSPLSPRSPCWCSAC